MDVEAHDSMRRHVQLLDRHVAVRIGELPVELVPVDADDERAALGPRSRNVTDAGQLVEDEDEDPRDDQHRNRCPDQLESRCAVDLRTFRVARPPAPSIAEDEPEQRSFDDDEDDPGQEPDQLVARVDARGVRRVRRLGREATVPGMRNGGDRQRDAEEQSEDEELSPH